MIEHISGHWPIQLELKQRQFRTCTSFPGSDASTDTSGIQSLKDLGAPSSSQEERFTWFHLREASYKDSLKWWVQNPIDVSREYSQETLPQSNSQQAFNLLLLPLSGGFTSAVKKGWHVHLIYDLTLPEGQKPTWMWEWDSVDGDGAGEALLWTPVGRSFSHWQQTPPSQHYWGLGGVMCVKMLGSAVHNKTSKFWEPKEGTGSKSEGWEPLRQL